VSRDATVLLSSYVFPPPGRGSVEGGGVGGGFVPVKCDRLRAGDVDGATAGGFDAVAKG